MISNKMTNTLLIQSINNIYPMSVSYNSPIIIHTYHSAEILDIA
jgi:hypothetical protein